MPNELSGWRRAAVIRGDVTSTGLVLALSGVGGAVAALFGAVPPAAGVAAIAVGVLGAWMVQRGRSAWRALLVEVTRAHDGQHPGASPVSWVSDDVWRTRNRFDPALDAAVLLMAEMDPEVLAFGRDALGAFTEPVLRPVTPEERALATAATDVPLDAGQTDAPSGGAEGMLAALAATPGRFIAVAPRWPVCCGRLAVLVAVGGPDVDPAALFLAPKSGDVEAPTPGAGIHGFACAECARRYTTDPAW